MLEVLLTKKKIYEEIKPEKMLKDFAFLRREIFTSKEKSKRYRVMILKVITKIKKNQKRI